MSERVLTDADLNAIEATIERVVRRVLRDEMPGGLLDTEQVANHIGMSTDWVRDHAAEMGGMRLGDNDRGHLRFDLRRVMDAMERRQVAGGEQPERRRRPGPARGVPDVDLLPIPKD